MDFLQSLLDNSSIPAITAFILGILTAVSPCPLATNITAIGFISKDIENHHRIFINGLLYTFGRIVSYTVLGFILIPILREGASMFMVQKAISKYGEMLIAPALIIIGIFMLDVIKLNLPKINIGGESLKKRLKVVGEQCYWVFYSPLLFVLPVEYFISVCLCLCQQRKRAGISYL